MAPATLTETIKKPRAKKVDLKLPDEFSETKPVENRASVASFVNRSYGVKAAFYKPDDIELFANICAAYKLGENTIQFNPELMYSVHPAVVCLPLDKAQGFLPCDEFGFMRLNLSQTFVRPHLANVQSCHRFNAPQDVRAPFGNLSYMANGFWATYGIYKRSDSQVGFAYPTFKAVKGRLLDVTAEELGLPNLVATVNVLIGYDTEGVASAMFSRVYGVPKLGADDTRRSGVPVLGRLANYFRYSLGLRVYGATKWECNFHNPFGRGMRRIGRDTVVNIVSPKVPAQIVSATKVADKTIRQLVYRYPDIPRPKSVDEPTREILWVSESQPAHRYWDNSEVGSTHISLPTVSFGGNALFDAGNMSATPGYRPLRDQIARCSACGVDNEESTRVRVQDYSGMLLCDNCMAHKYVYSEWSGTYIDKHTAVKFIRNYTGYSDYMSPEAAVTQLVKLDTPDFATGLLYVHKSCVQKYNVWTLGKDGVPSVEKVSLNPSELYAVYAHYNETVSSRVSEKLGIAPILATYAAQTGAWYPLCVHASNVEEFTNWLCGDAVKPVVSWEVDTSGLHAVYVNYTSDGCVYAEFSNGKSLYVSPSQEQLVSTPLPVMVEFMTKLVRLAGEAVYYSPLQADMYDIQGFIDTPDAECSRDHIRPTRTYKQSTSTTGRDWAIDGRSAFDQPVQTITIPLGGSGGISNLSLIAETHTVYDEGVLQQVRQNIQDGNNEETEVPRAYQDLLNASIASRRTRIEEVMEAAAIRTAAIEEAAAVRAEEIEDVYF